MLGEVVDVGGREIADSAVDQCPDASTGCPGRATGPQGLARRPHGPRLWPKLRRSQSAPRHSRLDELNQIPDFVHSEHVDNV